MKILLIGKYPPMQGGISSKTYWLVKRLKNIGFEYKIVTLNEPDYSTKDISSDSKDITIIAKSDIPWHIPETSLIDDKITHASLETAKAFNPDIVETNYLWPFCKDALLISKLIKKPLLIRHAGSDIAKFYNTGNYTAIMDMYFNQAAAIVTNLSSKTILNNICNTPEKIHCIQRYVPYPETFKPAVQPCMNNTEKPFDILFAGKINYHWRYKGLELLLKTIKKKNMRALFIIGGKYKSDIKKQIAEKQIKENIKLVDFVHPEQMPEIYRSCRFVWCWENPGGVDDFSNIIWEAIFCNTPCIVNNITKEKIKAEGVSKNFDALLLEVDDTSLFEFDFKSVTTETNLSKYKALIYEKYIDRNVALYKNLL
jgi:glycosyltransferase involved in cell wall biosynthesis